MGPDTLGCSKISDEGKEYPPQEFIEEAIDFYVIKICRIRLIDENNNNNKMFLISIKYAYHNYDINFMYQLMSNVLNYNTVINIIMHSIKIRTTDEKTKRSRQINNCLMD